MIIPTNMANLEDLGEVTGRTMEDYDLSQLLFMIKVRVKTRLANKVDSIDFQEDPLNNFRDGFRFVVRKNGKAFVSPIIDFYCNLIPCDVKKVRHGKLYELFLGEELVYDCRRYVENIIDIHCIAVEDKLQEYNLH